jgi:hypothetical protein
MVRLVSGTFSDGGLQLHASSTSTFIYTSGAFVNATSLAGGQWVPLSLDLTTVTTAGFDPTQIVQIGVQTYSGFSSNGGSFTGSGTVVLEIDTVTD